MTNALDGWARALDLRVQAALDDNPDRITFYVGGVVAATRSRTLAGEVVAYGGPADADHPDGLNVGLTSVGPLRVAARGQIIETPNGPVTATGLTWSDDVGAVKLTEDHDRDTVRGFAVRLDDTPARLRATFKATDDADGDRAIAEAHPDNRKRDGFSLDVINGAVVEAADGGVPWLVSAVLIAVGQVGLPAFYSGSRIDTVAASAATTPTQEGEIAVLTSEERARLAELLAMNNRSAEEEAEFTGLRDRAVAEAAQPAGQEGEEAPEAPAAPPAPTAVAAQLVPGGSPRPGRPAVRTNESALDRFCTDLWDALQGNADALRNLRVSAALTDVTHTAHAPNIALPAWSGELWTGVQYEPEFTPLLNSGSLTSRKGQGWRWVTKPELDDYAGDKAAIPSSTPDTEASEYTAARMALGHDIDRAYYDFPDGAPFIRAYVEAVRESFPVKLDGKVEAWIGTNMVDSGLDPIEYGTGASDLPAAVLKAVGLLRRVVKRAKLGNATFVVMHDDLFDSLLDMTNLDVPAFLELFGIAPGNFTSSSLAAFEGKVAVGTKMTATVRTLPGSPIRVSAQDIVKGGIDEAFFAYWAIEEHATNGIQYAEVVAATP